MLSPNTEKVLLYNGCQKSVLFATFFVNNIVVSTLSFQHVPIFEIQQFLDDHLIIETFVNTEIKLIWYYEYLLVRFNYIFFN